MKLTEAQISQFQQQMWDYYHKHNRRFPWRRTHDPYKIFVSEIMLQQTQTGRVVPKYLAFIKKYPTFESLAKGSVGDVLKLWQGLGYNKRALSLKKSAEIIVAKYGGILPKDTNQLIGLPGIGKYTAGALMAFVHNLATAFIETNIRRTYLHVFFHDQTDIDDKQILDLILQTLDQENPREWYFALMDYGAMLGLQTENANTKSKHYIKQSKFEGSTRQLRGKILKLVTTSTHPLSTQKIAARLEQPIATVELILSTLEKEGFIEINEDELWNIIN
jgi:A/G-specific adenine glycosylase